MMLSGEEYLRVSQFRTARQVERGVLSVSGPQVTWDNGTSVDLGEVQRVAEMAEQQPDVRDQIVASLRQRIESGSYQVSGEQIAEMMVRRLLADRVR